MNLEVKININGVDACEEELAEYIQQQMPFPFTKENLNYIKQKAHDAVLDHIRVEIQLLDEHGNVL